MIIEVRVEQSLNANASIEVIDSGIVIDFKDKHSSKAKLPIEVILFGIIMDFKLWQC